MLFAEVEMSGRTIVMVLVLATAFLAGIVVLHGRGHESLRRWLPAIHGGHR